MIFIWYTHNLLKTAKKPKVMWFLSHTEPQTAVRLYIKVKTAITSKRNNLLTWFFFRGLKMTPTILTTPKIPQIEKKIPLIKGAVALDFCVWGSVFIWAAALTAYRADEYLRTIVSCNALLNDKKNGISKKKRMNFWLLRRYTVKTWIQVKYDV